MLETRRSRLEGREHVFTLKEIKRIENKSSQEEKKSLHFRCSLWLTLVFWDGHTQAKLSTTQSDLRFQISDLVEFM